MPKTRSHKKKRVESEKFPDDASVTSYQSNESDVRTTFQEDRGLENQSIFDNICGYIESLGEKRSETRVKGLISLIDLFRKNYFDFDSTWNYSNTLLNGIEIILKKGKVKEQVLASQLFTLCCLQFEFGDADFYANFYPIFDQNIRDSSVHCELRSNCAIATTVASFLVCDYSDPCTLMKILEGIFKNFGMSSNGKCRTFEQAVSTLHSTALKCWILLFIFLSSSDIYSIGTAILPVLKSLLQSSSLELRITAGEAVTIIYERIREEMKENYKGPHFHDIAQLLEDLAVDYSKINCKEVRKKQRQSFRELADAFIRFECPETSVNFGPDVLLLSTSCSNFLYSFFCSIFSSGMNQHLRENVQLRNVFDLCHPSLVEEQKFGFDRFLRDQRKQANSLADKLRTQKIKTYRADRCYMLNEMVD